MAGKNGGARPGAGRPKGARTVITEEALRKAGEGETPLEYMLRVMRDVTQPVERRDRMAVGAAQYCHAKAVEVTGANGGPVEYTQIERAIVDEHRDEHREEQGRHVTH